VVVSGLGNKNGNAANEFLIGERMLWEDKFAPLMMTMMNANFRFDFPFEQSFD